jgi:hypothetical protein
MGVLTGPNMTISRKSVSWVLMGCLTLPRRVITRLEQGLDVQRPGLEQRAGGRRAQRCA